MNEKDFLKISNSRIFLGADEKLLRSVLWSSECSITSYSAGETVCESESRLRAIGIILSGNATVLSEDKGRSVLLRRLTTSDIFGVSSVFSKEENFVSRICAKSPCSVAFISSAGLSMLLENDNAILYNYIDFLADRIRFLNRKIKFFTSGSAERRLAVYLDSFREDEVVLKESMSAIAEMLDIGRASLYRAFDKLTEDGFIKREKNSVKLLDRANMINYYDK